MKDLVYAIDFGTSNSLLTACSKDKVFEPAPLEPEGPEPQILRSILYFPHADACFYGKNAIYEYCENTGHGRLIRSIKKFLPDTKFTGSWIEDRLVRLEDLIGLFLLEMKKRADKHYDTQSTKLLLGRPAKFSFDPEKDKMAQWRLEKAAEIAGFKEVKFCPEPLAAAFDVKRELKKETLVLVVDLGGGTSDFTVIKITPNEFKEEDVLGLGGVSVAGDKMDSSLMKNKISKHFGAEVKYRVPLGSNILQMPRSLLDNICAPAEISQLQRKPYMEFLRKVENWALSEDDKESMQNLYTLVDDQLGFQLFEQIEGTKRELSMGDEAEFDFTYADMKIVSKLSRQEFNQYINDSTEKIFESLEETLTQAGVTPGQIDLVSCTGGTSKIPKVQNYLHKKFGPEKLQDRDFFRSVIHGLGQRAQQLYYS